MMLRYLKVENTTNTIFVDVSARDWADHRSEVHFQYHRATVCMLEGRGFKVDVDASRVPYACLLHIGLFVRLCMYARRELKDRLVRVTIRNASAPARRLYQLLEWGLVIPPPTARKIIFVGKDAKKSN